LGMICCNMSSVIIGASPSGYKHGCCFSFTWLVAFISQRRKKF